MRDCGLILIGLLVLVGLLTFPIWYDTLAGTSGQAPVLAKATGDACVYPAEYMRNNHMNILIEWRDQVVRNGNRFVSVSGKRYEMSLTKTCLDCHADKAEFCDKCHNYAGVSPYCWECHVDGSVAAPVAARIHAGAAAASFPGARYAD